MIWKKNVFSYGLWAVYLSGAGAILACMGIYTGRMLGLNTLFGIGVAVLMFLAAAVLVLGGQKLSPVIEGWKSKGESNLLIAEGTALVGLLALGIIFRVMNLSYAGEEASYYETAKIIEGQGIPQIAHGGVYFYLELLHMLFLLVGNKWIAGIWLQIILQLIACVLLYLAVRKMAGRVPALVMISVLMLSPQSIADGIMYSPRMMYLCLYGVGLLCAAVYLHKQSEGRIRFGFDWIFLFLAGVLFAVIGYVDITGFTLFVFLLSVLWMKKVPSGNIWGNSFLQLGVISLGAIAGFLGAIFLDAFASGKTAGGIFSAWCGLYAPGKADMLAVWSQTGDFLVYLILAVLLAAGVLSFWCRRENEKFSPWILAAVVLLLMEVFRITTPEISAVGYMLYLLGALAGISVAECFVKNESFAEAVSEKRSTSKTVRKNDDGVEWLDEEEGKTEELKQENAGIMAEVKLEQEKMTDRPKGEKTEEVSAQDTEAKKSAVRGKSVNKQKESKMSRRKKKAVKKAGQAETETDGLVVLEEGNPPAPSINFIENPLPLPKKHVKKTMDYGFDPAQDQMKYDIEIKDNDNFDII